MPYTVHAQVINLTRSATKASTERYLTSHFKDSQPVIYNLIPDGASSLRAVVCFRSKSKKHARKAIKHLNDQRLPFVDDLACSSIPSIDVGCEGLTILKNDSRDPDFDVCFVHGLGGHALRTFSSSNSKHQQICTWPRDLLPGYLETGSFRGRYTSFGHDHDVLIGDRIAETLDDTALNLIRALNYLRGRACEKPLFLVCHSLGGLIVSKAVSLALSQDLKDQNPLPVDLRETFGSDEASIVKGIFFFGTPFKGTMSARIGALSATRLGLHRFINTTTLTYLAVRNNEINHTVDEFERLVKQHNIKIIIFYERLRLNRGVFKKLIVSRHSAGGRFGSKVEKIGLPRNHSTLVKYTGPEDKIFRDMVVTVIKRTVDEALRSQHTVHFLSTATVNKLEDALGRRANRQPPVSNLSSLETLVYGMKDGLVLDMNLSIDLPSFSTKQSSKEVIDSFWHLLDMTLSKILPLKNVPVPGTCDWIFEQPRFQNWYAADDSQILFIQGRAGYGKSWLAEFLIKRVLNRDLSDSISPISTANVKQKVPGLSEDPSGAYLVTWFCASLQEIQSPKRILLQIVAQIARERPQDVLDGFVSCIQDTKGTINEVLLWKVLHYVRRTVKGKLFCVVDGLDQCIDAMRTRETPNLDPRMVRFIETVCEVADQDITTFNLCTKILVLTRAKPEIRSAIGVRDIVLEIEQKHILSSVRLVIEAELERLTKMKLVRDAERLPITEAIAAKCGPIFLMANRLLESLKLDQCDRSSLQTILGFIAETRDQSLDDVHKKYLSSVLEENIMRGAITMLKAVYYADKSLTKAALQEILAVDLDSKSFDTFLRRNEANDVEILLQKEFGLLFKDNNDLGISFNHFSVRSLLGELSLDPSHSVSMFSCRNEKQGHLFMMRLCLQYMVFVLCDSEWPKDIELTSSTWKFLSYAIFNWTYHAKLAGEQVTNGLSEIMAWLETPYVFGLSQIIEQNINLDNKFEVMQFRPMAPPEYFASRGLFDLVTMFFVPPPPRLLTMFPWRRRQRASGLSETSFDINEKGYEDRTLLHYACTNGSVDNVRHLLDCGASGSSVDEYGETPLFDAVRGGQFDICKLLVNRNQAVKVQNTRGLSCLFLACEDESFEIARLLLEQGFDPNTTASRGWAPIHVAAENNAVEIFELLVAFGAKIDVTRTNGVNCLHQAALSGSLAIIKTLQKYNNYKALNCPAPSTGCTPLLYAAHYGQKEAFEFLRNSESVLVRDNDGWGPIHYASLKGWDSIVKSLCETSQISDLTKDNESALHVAAHEGHIKLVKLLIDDFGMDPDLRCDERQHSHNPKTKNTISPLFLACESGHFDVAEFLSRKRVDFAVQSSMQQNLLHFAIRTASVEICRLLVEKGVDALATDEYGNNILHCAAAGGHVKQLEAILEGKYGVVPPIDQVNKNGESALFVAASEGQGDFMKRLIAEGADTHATNLDGKTILHRFAFKDTPIPLDLSEYKTELDKLDAFGNTPLHNAAGDGRVTVLEQLINAGADVNVVNQFGATSIILAARYWRKDATLLLLQKKADLSVRDDFGQTLPDIIYNRKEYFGVLQALDMSYSPLDDSEVQKIVHRTLLRLMQQLDLTKDIKNSLTRWKIHHIRDCFLILDSFDDARLCWETSQGLDNKYQPFDGCYCDLCGAKNDIGPWAHCSRCLGTVICDDCYGYNPDTRPSGCKLSHKYVLVGGRESRIFKQTEEELEEAFRVWHSEKLAALELQQSPE